MPHPVALPAIAIQSARARASVTRARWKRLMAVKLARKQTAPASTTSRQSCSPSWQVRTRNIWSLLSSEGEHRYYPAVSLGLILIAAGGVLRQYARAWQELSTPILGGHPHALVSFYRKRIVPNAARPRVSTR